MRVLLAFGLLSLGFPALAVSPRTATAAPYLPPAGYTRAPETFVGDTAFDTGAFAVAPDGKVALGTTNFSGGASIKVYVDAAAAQAKAAPLRTFTDPAFRAWGDITFADNDTLLFTENGGASAADAVWRGVVSSGATTNLGNVPNATGVAASSGVGGDKILVTAANSPGAGALFEISGGTPTPVLSNLGVGYLGGIAVDAAGNLLIADTNDPAFSGNAGRLLRFTGAYEALPFIDLAAGGGSGAYDVAVDSDGDVFVTTGTTLTVVPDGGLTAEQFGGDFGAFAFATGLEFAGSGFESHAGSGTLWINAVFGDDGAVIGITPAVPEPAAIGILAAAAAVCLRRRAKNAVLFTAAVSLVVWSTPARAEQFYASQIIARTVGGQQQSGFTDPALALGAPRGGGTTTNSIDAYNLGNGGSLTLGFDDGTTPRAIHNAPGLDFIIFENAFLDGDDPTRSFAELMWVEVSTNGSEFARMPSRSRTPAAVGPYGTIDPADTKAFAGVNPVHANVDENDVDPFDPATAGGDAFDLCWLVADPLVMSGAVDLDVVRYIRLVDVIGDGTSLDFSGRPIFDPTGIGIGGADVDAVAVLHGVTLPDSGSSNPEPTSAATLCALAAALSLRRRRS